MSDVINTKTENTNILEIILSHPDFQDYKPKRVKKDLSRASHFFWVCVGDQLRWETATRHSPGLYPWNERGWYIDLPAIHSIAPVSGAGYFDEGVVWGLVDNLWVEVRFDNKTNGFYREGVRVAPRFIVPVRKEIVLNLYKVGQEMCSVVHE